MCDLQGRFGGLGCLLLIPDPVSLCLCLIFGVHGVYPVVLHISRKQRILVLCALPKIRLPEIIFDPADDLHDGIELVIDGDRLVHIGDLILFKFADSRFRVSHFLNDSAFALIIGNLLLQLAGSIIHALRTARVNILFIVRFLFGSVCT